MKRKKVVKMRGSKTYGYGSKKKHRGAGSRGGRGRAGTKKHMKIWLWKRGQKLGKLGFKSLSQRAIEPQVKSINLRDLEKLAKAKEIDITKLGYSKVLGAGKISKPLIVKANAFSKKAEDKIKKSGGKTVKI